MWIWIIPGLFVVYGLYAFVAVRVGDKISRDSSFCGPTIDVRFLAKSYCIDREKLLVVLAFSVVPVSVVSAPWYKFQLSRKRRKARNERVATEQSEAKLATEFEAIFGYSPNKGPSNGEQFNAQAWVDGELTRLARRMQSAFVLQESMRRSGVDGARIDALAAKVKKDFWLACSLANRHGRTVRAKYTDYLEVGKSVAA